MLTTRPETNPGKRLAECIRSLLFGVALLFMSMGFSARNALAQEFMPGKKAPTKYEVDRRIDNMGYWKRMADWGLVPVSPVRSVDRPTPKTPLITDAAVVTSNSPDIPVTVLNSTQSENSVFINPNNRLNVLNSNNSSDNPYPGYFFGADDFFSSDGGENWEGQIHGTGSINMGDPSTAINSFGRWYVGFIHSGGGQALAYSNDTGTTWKVRAIAAPPQLFGGLLDKSHLWVDNSPASPYLGFMYDGWTVITGPDDGKLQVARSTDKGLAWQIPVTISDSVHAGSHNQGINIATGPNGQVYATWSIYDQFPGDENALGFARSFDGGHTWQPAVRILDSIRGIRLHGVPQTLRTNSFPSMAVDNSESPWKGTIYIVWANVNYPGINTGPGVEVYMIRSADSGVTWSQPLRINQEPPGTGKHHFFPWISCDPVNGNLSVIFYDDRDTPTNQLEAWVATSTDGGDNWQDFRISDVSFTPAPVTGLSDNYFGDYLGIAARNSRVYPCWTDNRTGLAMAYVSPFQLGPDPGQPYVAFRSFFYNDTLTGNGNSLAEYNENALLSLSLRNMGDQADTAVHITLRSESAYLTFTDSTGFIDLIPAGETRTLQDEFALHIADSVPNGEKMIIALQAVDSHDSLFVSYFSLKANAPGIMIMELLVDDEAGNNSHSLDPGEHATVSVRLHNPTNYPAENVSCSFQSLQGFATVDPAQVNVGTLAPGETRDVPFQVLVDEVTAGPLASFDAVCWFSEQQLSRRFNVKIGLIFEDWESGDFSKFSWSCPDFHPWKIDSTYHAEGRFSARSGSIGNESTSSLTVNSRALTYDSISFYRKVSSEARFDFLNFYIDGSRVGQWAGELDWERVAFPVIPGNHTFTWTYSKDQELSVGMDMAFIDFIEFPSIQYTTADAGKDVTIYECQDLTCNGIATYYDSIHWTSTGSGIFADPRDLHTRYLPSVADKEAGMVTLILTVYGSTVNDLAVDSMNLTILPKPSAYAGPDAGICAGDSYAVAGASASNYTSLSWHTTGDGHFGDAAILMPQYYPGSQDSTKGSVTLYLTSYAGNNDACGYATDSMLLTLYPLPVIPLEENYFRCTGYSVHLDATVEGGTVYAWSPGGESSASIEADSAGIGAGEALYHVTVTAGHGCMNTKSIRLTFENCDQKVQAGKVFFRIYPNPVIDIFNVELYSPVKEQAKYTLTAMDGAVVMESHDFEINGWMNQLVDIQHLGQGAYMFTLYTSDSAASRLIIIP